MTTEVPWLQELDPVPWPCLRALPEWGAEGQGWSLEPPESLGSIGLPACRTHG